MTRTLALAALVLLSACGKKDAEPASSGSESTTASSGANVPSDKDSQDFAKTLTSTPIHNFSPADAGSVKFEYVTLTFKADNTWVAVSRMGIGDETVDCKEQGTWTMDPAERANTAAMEWKLTATTCPGRPTENIMRTKVVFKEGQAEIFMR